MRASGRPRVRSRQHHRPHPPVGEQLEQEGVGHPAVEDVGPAHARRARPWRTPRPWGPSRPSTTPSEATSRHRARRDVTRCSSATGSSAVGPNPRHVGQEDQLLGPERGGHRPGHRVGVDVVGLAGGVDADGGHDRDEALGQEAREDRRVDATARRPRSPSSPSAGSAVIRWASSPESPTASGPWTLMAETMSRLTLPTSTMRAMSSVSASVTRSPSRNSASLPRRRIISPIWGPPPWTTTGSSPTERTSTMSSAKEARAASRAPAGRPELAARPGRCRRT